MLCVQNQYSKEVRGFLLPVLEYTSESRCALREWDHHVLACVCDVSPGSLQVLLHVLTLW
jgi:hypothetical protein